MAIIAPGTGQLTGTGIFSMPVGATQTGIHSDHQVYACVIYHLISVLFILFDMESINYSFILCISLHRVDFCKGKVVVLYV